MASMVLMDEQDALGNYAYAYNLELHPVGAPNYYRGQSLALFYKLLAFLADNLPSDVPLPLLDLVELGSKFLAEI